MILDAGRAAVDAARLLLSLTGAAPAIGKLVRLQFGWQLVGKDMPKQLMGSSGQIRQTAPSARHCRLPISWPFAEREAR
jgi:hypothetical protein